MVKSLISLVLLLISAYLAFSHGWGSINLKKHPEALKMMDELGISETMMPIFGGATLLIGILLLIPRTFFLGNMLSAISIVTIMALAMRVGNFKLVLIEIPFLIMPLVLIWLKFPFLKVN